MTGDQEPHALERTSAKGDHFIGRCWKCGKDSLLSPFDEMPCANPAGEGQDESLLHAIEGDDHA